MEAIGKLYSVKEVTDLAGISRRHLYNLWERDEGPKVVRLGGRLFVTARDYETWINEARGEHGDDNTTGGQ